MANTPADRNLKGQQFERVAGSLLETLRSSHPDLVTVNRQPRALLHDSEVVIPDYELKYRLPFQTNSHLIECQHRKRSSQTIVRKIRHVKSLSDRNCFIFVYLTHDFLSSKVRKAVLADGIVHYDLRDFAGFLGKLSHVSASLSEPMPMSPLRFFITVDAHLKDYPAARDRLSDLLEKDFIGPDEMPSGFHRGEWLSSMDAHNNWVKLTTGAGAPRRQLAQRDRPRDDH